MANEGLDATGKVQVRGGGVEEQLSPMSIREGRSHLGRRRSPRLHLGPVEEVRLFPGRQTDRRVAGEDGCQSGGAAFLRTDDRGGDHRDDSVRALVGETDVCRGIGCATAHGVHEMIGNGAVSKGMDRTVTRP